MAGVSLVKVKGLYHWRSSAASERRRTEALNAYGRLADFFAVSDLVAPVGLWLAAAWGAVVWLMTVVSIAVASVHPAGLWRQRFYRTRGFDAACDISVACDLCRAPPIEMIQRMISKSGRRFFGKDHVEQIAKSGCRHG